ncbi:MAG: AAA family ATPase [Vicinamibacterales bacterium]
MSDATPAPPTSPDAERRERLRAKANRVFTPSLPVSQESVFAGRADQVREVLDAINRPGQHVLILGEPGVGKTSLANILSSRVATKTKQVVAPRVNCERIDDFSSIWRKVFADVSVRHEKARIGFSAEKNVETRKVADTSPEEITTAYVLKTLRDLGKTTLVIVIIDEFDRIGDPDVRTAFADTIKLLSDQAVPATLVIVGVADTVDDLIEQHASIERALVQVRMPRMAPSELQQIVLRGLHLLDLTIDPEALVQIAALSQGLPHYTHVLALYAATAAIDEGATMVTAAHLSQAIRQAILRTQLSIASAYRKAIQARAGSTRYVDALLGCALAATDEHASFAVADVRAAFREFSGSEAPVLLRILAELTRGSRGPALQRTGVRHAPRFRFASPLMPPYVVMQAVAANRLAPERLRGDGSDVV